MIPNEMYMKERNPGSGKSTYFSHSLNYLKSNYGKCLTKKFKTNLKIARFRTCGSKISDNYCINNRQTSGNIVL
jgi:hypothetical protein